MTSIDMNSLVGFRESTDIGRIFRSCQHSLNVRNFQSVMQLASALFWKLHH